jgi:hypothetical protein
VRCSTIRRRTPRSGTRRPSHVVFGHPSVVAAAGDAPEVDAELLGDPSHQRRRPHLGFGRGARWRLERRFLVWLSRRRRCVSDGFALVADHDEHGSHGRHLALADEDPQDGPRGRRRNLDGRLVRLDFDQRLVLGHLLTLGDEPARDLSLRQPFTQVGQLELVRHYPTLSARPG